MNRFYASVGARQVHVTSAGSGPAIVLLHSLPLWSMAEAPLIEALGRDFLVIAPDLAGYGLADPLDDDEPDADAFAADVVAVLDQLGVSQAAVVAVGDSAPLGAVLARRMAERAAGLVLDNPFLLTAGERTALLADGLPSFAPETTGSHLLRIWDTARNHFMFRPHHQWTLANRLDRHMGSPEDVNEVLKAYIRAGEHYPKGIRAAQAIDLEAVLAGLSRPVLVLSDPSTKDERRPRPPQGGKALTTGQDGRAAAIAAFLRPLAGEAVSIAPPPRHPGKAGQFSRLFIPAQGPAGRGHLHALANFEGSGRPVVVMHDPAGSSALTTYYAHPMVGSRPVICPDLPGAGESDNIAGGEGVTPGDYAAAMHSALDALGLDEVDLVGRYSGGPVGMEMAFQRPERVRHLVQAATAVYTDDDVRDVLAHYTPTMAPRQDGSHLNLGWFNMKNQALFWPWFRQTREGIIWGEPQIDPDMIHQRVFDLLRTGDQYAHAYKAMWIYPMAERLGQLGTPQLLCAPRWDPIYPNMADLKALAPQPQAEVATLPDSFGDWGAVFTAWFDRTP